MSPRPSPPRPSSPNRGGQTKNRQSGSSGNIKQTIVNEITNLKKFSDYRIRTLVIHASEFGPYLKNKRLETNQIRKFLDAINRVKAQLVEVSKGDDTQQLPSALEDEIVLLKPKLAYAAARQEAALPLSEVMSVAIDKTTDFQDFNRLVQFIESIIAYHKAEGGK